MWAWEWSDAQVKCQNSPIRALPSVLPTSAEQLKEKPQRDGIRHTGVGQLTKL